MSLGPPYFHTQGGLQKYVGGATCDVIVRAWASQSQGTLKKRKKKEHNSFANQLRFT